MTQQENRDLVALGISPCATPSSTNCVLTQVHSVDPGTGMHELSNSTVQAMGNLVIGHMFVGGGDQPEVKPVLCGLLGADYKIENGRYRFARVYNGENWNRGLQAPLTQPGA